MITPFMNEVSSDIIGAAIAVHRELGPGLLESTYEACLAHEIRLRGRMVESQRALPVVYKGVHLDCGYRIDLWVEDLLVVELKAVRKLDSIDEAQLLSYLKLSGSQLGLLINFNVKMLKDGVHRFVLSEASAGDEDRTPGNAAYRQK